MTTDASLLGALIRHSRICAHATFPHLAQPSAGKELKVAIRNTREQNSFPLFCEEGEGGPLAGDEGVVLIVLTLFVCPTSALCASCRP